MWNQETIDSAVEAARVVVRGDGANLHCEDGTCLLPGRLLEGMIMAKLQEHIEGEFDLSLEDLRQT